MRLVTKKWRNDFKTNSNYETYYDIFEDFDAIESSFAQQYNIRLRKDLKTMTYGEFSSYISGLGPETALGNLVRIRSEKDPDTIKKFNESEKRIRNEWVSKHVREMSPEEYDRAMKNLERILTSMGKEANK